MSGALSTMTTPYQHSKTDPDTHPTTIKPPTAPSTHSTTTTLVDPANPPHQDPSHTHGKYPKDPFSRPWSSPEEERAALQAFADEKSHVTPGTDGTWLPWNAVGGGVKAMEWGGLPEGEDSVYRQEKYGSSRAGPKGEGTGAPEIGEGSKSGEGEGKEEGKVKKMLHGLMGRRKSEAVGEGEERREGGGDGVIR